MMWLVEVSTGDLADALRRDLLSDRLTLDELGWDGLWSYITTAPPLTAIHFKRSEGWTLGDKIAAEQLYELRKLGWRYTAVHFQDGAKTPVPEPIEYPGAGKTEEAVTAHSWETVTLDEMVSPEVRVLLQGGVPSRS